MGRDEDSDGAKQSIRQQKSEQHSAILVLVLSIAGLLLGLDLHISYRSGEITIE